MLDCPEHTQTSPTKTLLNVTVCGPETFSVYGPPVGSGGRCAIHAPSAPATACAPLPAMLTRTVAPGVVHPHTGSDWPRWRTMSSLNSGFKNGRSADEAAACASAGTGAASAAHKSRGTRKWSS